MICIRCGATQPDNAHFCPNCGAQLSSEAISKQQAEKSMQASTNEAVLHQPVETPLEATTPRQRSITLEPMLRQQPTNSDAVVPPLSVSQHWEKFGPGSGVLAPQSSPYPAEPPHMPGEQLYPPLVSKGPITPLPQIPDAPPYPPIANMGPITPLPPTFVAPPYSPIANMGPITPLPPTPGAPPRFTPTGNMGPFPQTFSAQLYPPTGNTGQIALPPKRPSWLNTFEQRFAVLTQPLPLLVTLCTTALVVIILIGLQLTGSDWAAGAFHAASAASIIGLLVALWAGARALAGLRQIKKYIGPALAVLILLTLGGIGFSQQSSIHTMQGRNWEGQQQWDFAITEFQLAGEGTPTSDQISRVYNEWGEQLSSAQRYVEALAKFDIVLDNYNHATTQVARAQANEIKASLALAQQTLQQHDYSTATKRLDALLRLSYCDNNCQSQANALDATAYYSQAETQLSASQYDDAATSFQALLTRFPNAPEASKVHPDFARALLGRGQLQRTTSCSSAIPTYQQLSTQFADTPEGQTATKALKEPQKVTGHFTSTIPNNPALTSFAALMQGLRQNITSNELGTLLAKSPQTNIASNGNFAFDPQPQGSYQLAWGSINNRTGSGRLSWNVARYVATVGPLCAYDFGDIGEAIPVP
ncbi:MAG: zinc-ribbon domain-containing protein [Chloroflexi bacterium]|nr:MAG: zinc-ribbon domain-containing protein [Chloroflexota bacterium]